jgi:fumarylacetoacetate (FAA) hydrolase family protein
MNDAYRMTLVNDQIKTVGVAFDPFGKVYTYLTILDLEEGQEVIVGTSNDNRLQVVTVVRVDEDPNIDPKSQIKYGWVLSTAGTTARKEQERLLMLEEQTLKILKTAEKRAQRQRIRKELNEVYGKDLKKIKAIDFTADPLT